MKILCSILRGLALYFPNVNTLVSLRDDSTVDSTHLKSAGWSEKLQALTTLGLFFEENPAEE